MSLSRVSKTLRPATEALSRALQEGPTTLPSQLTSTMSSCSSLKRSRSEMGGFDKFDMSSFVEASKQVEESISFPLIEWPSLDDEDIEEEKNDNNSSQDSFPSLGWPGLDEDSDEEEDEFKAFHRPKRLCRGLVRSKNSFNLASLSSTPRLGSAGSLC